MGRTHRRRRSKTTRKFHVCEDSEELISLNTWLSAKGLVRNPKLVLAVFDDTGRGVLTKKKIHPGEELMNMPLSLTINVITVLSDKVFNGIFLDNHCFFENKNSMPFQCLLAFYLVFHRMQQTESKWYIYLQNLPKEYTVPYFLPNDLKRHLDAGILAVISKQKDIIDSSFNIFERILKSCCFQNEFIQELKISFSKIDYEWAYFTVNTRCVFMDLTRVVDMKNTENTVLQLLMDNTKIALCPYLDMINHSPKARNQTKLLLNKDTETISIQNIKEALFTDIRFSIYTKNVFDPYTQVFICYGDSYNLKLVTEYGFFLPSNDLDFVLFEFDNIVSYLKTKNIKLSQDQVTFIMNHGLKKDLYIDFKGLSFNFYALLMVVKHYYKKDIDVSRVIYSSMDNFNDKSINEIIVPLVNKKIDKIKMSLDELYRSSYKCVTLENCVELMCQYVRLLEKFIQC